MRNAKRTILIAMVICAGLVSVCLARNRRGKAKPVRMSILEILDKYAGTQDRLQSFRLKSKDMINSSWSFQGGQNRLQYRETDFRFDGDRTSFRDNIWGDIGGRSFTRNEAKYYSTLWNRKSFIRHSRRSDLSTVGRVVIHNDKKRGEKLGKETVSRAYQGHSLMGYFYGDDERVDSILRQAASISVRRENEKVNGIDCFVIDATTLERGRYTLWIDPEHGYNIAKAELRRDGKHQHKFYGRPMREDEKILGSLESVRFKKIDNVWVPMEADDSVNRTWDKDQDFYRYKNHHERVEFVLNPDHDALGSFVPDDIKNGAKVYIKQVPGVHYTWQDGKVVDEDGREVDVDKLIKAESEKVKNPKPKRK